MPVAYRIVLLTACLLMAVLPPAAGQEPLTLDEAIRVARENSPDLRQSRMSLEQSRERLKAQQASLRSRFSLTLTPFSFNRSREFNPFFSTFNTSESREAGGVFTVNQPLVATDGVLSLRNQFEWRDAFSEFSDTQTETYSNNLFLAFNQPLFTYNRTKLELASVELDLQSAQLNYDLRVLLLEQQVAQAFYSAFQARMRLQVAEEEYQNTQTSYGIVENKVDAGLAAREELYQAELNLTNSRSAVQNQRVGLENALDEFKQLIGMPLDDMVTVAADVSEAVVQVDLQQALEHGLQHRMELRQRQIDIVNARANLTRAGATNEFRGNLDLSYGIFGNNEEIDLLYDQPTQSQSFTVSLEIPLYDWGERKSRMRAAEIGVRQSELSREETRTQIAIEIRRAVRTLANQAVQIEIARQNVRVAQLTYDINLERFRNGDLTSMDLNLVQAQLSDAKTGLVDAMINYRLALLDLKVKSLYDFERDASVLDTD